MAWTHIDLFAGIGGFRLAATRNGGRCIGYSEKEAILHMAQSQNYPVIAWRAFLLCAPGPRYIIEIRQPPGTVTAVLL